MIIIQLKITETQKEKLIYSYDLLYEKHVENSEF